jgi:hypothetical protein
MAQSLMDYIVRRLAVDYLRYDKRLALGIFTADDPAPQRTGQDRRTRAVARQRASPAARY